MGFADELGSGVRNLFKYTGFFSKGGYPQLIEDDIFRIIIPIVNTNEDDTMQVTMQDTMQVTMQAEWNKAILTFCETPKSRDAIQNLIKISNRDYFRKEILNPVHVFESWGGNIVLLI